MSIESIIEDYAGKVKENTVDYQGDKTELKSHLIKTLAGGAAILGLSALNAPDIIEAAAYLYTAYNGFKACRDFKHV